MKCDDRYPIRFTLRFPPDISLPVWGLQVVSVDKGVVKILTPVCFRFLEKCVEVGPLLKAGKDLAAGRIKPNISGDATRAAPVYVYTKSRTCIKRLWSHIKLAIMVVISVNG